MDLIDLVGLVFTIIFYLVLADVIVSWILDPLHPIRRYLDSIVQPMLDPIRRIIPATSGIDFSPFVLLLVLRVVRSLVEGLLT